MIFQDIKILNSLIFWHPKRLLLSLWRAGYWINPLPSRKWFSFQRGRACGCDSHASWIFWPTQILRVNLISKQRISPMNLISGSLWSLCVVWRGVCPLLWLICLVYGLDVRSLAIMNQWPGRITTLIALVWVSLESWHVIVWYQSSTKENAKDSFVSYMVIICELS